MFISSSPIKTFTVNVPIHIPEVVSPVVRSVVGEFETGTPSRRKVLSLSSGGGDSFRHQPQTFQLLKELRFKKGWLGISGHGLQGLRYPLQDSLQNLFRSHPLCIRCQVKNDAVD